MCSDTRPEKKKALIAMSGGVDSSVAALLMKEAGYECAGVTMKLFENSDIDMPGDRPCCSLDDAGDAARVAADIGIAHYVFDFCEDFRSEVMDSFVSGYERGRTPNPCIDCNRYLKFDRLFERMRGMGFDLLVTGHYARIEREEGSGGLLLKKGKDKAKDQSYVLYTLSREQLAHTAFPLGSYTKDEIRAIASAHGFVNSQKPDSQDICFVTAGTYADFIRSYSGKEYPPGDFVDLSGKKIGRHRGIVNYTIGQRKGLGETFGRPVYVKAIDPEKNEVMLCAGDELYSDSCIVRDINLISVDAADLSEPRRVYAKLRYSQAASPALALMRDKDEIELSFDQPVRAVTKGQSAVLYDADDPDVLIGGGIIEA